ncbi:MAG: ABC-F family ATP-binding cassette domain-containing protein [Hyphomonas sp.]
MLTISDLDYRIAARPLFEKASAQIAAGWKVGLVGRNGTGKSTLLRLIREEVESPSSDGSIRLNKGARLGWVAQEVAASDETILDVVLAADAERHALLQEAETAEDPMRIADIHTRLIDIDAWTADSRAAEVLMGLGFTNEDLSRPTKEFSGGWRMRAAIAGVLFSQPEMLLLDEPTNYLDLEGAAWLEAYLKKYPYTVLLVSHDRELLNRCVTHTMALEHKKLSICVGGYDDWLKMRATKLAQLESQQAKQDADRKHLEAFVERFRAKASKARQAQSRVKMLEKMQDVTIPIAERTVPFKFLDPKDKLAPPMLTLEGADLGYGEGAKILSKVNLRLDPDDRIAIVGANGQGKTTLVKSIAERLPLMGGDRKVPKAIRIGYFSQDQLDELVLGDTVLDHVRRVMEKGTPEAKVRGLGAQMGFSHEKIETKVEKLSGGEKVRLLLGLMSVERPHILILDEPTSHLDIDSREALIYALNDFPGAVLLITHDVYLAEATADQLWLVRNGRAQPYDGDLRDYRALVMQADRTGGDAGKKATPVGEKRKPNVNVSALKKAAAEADAKLEQLTKELSQLDEKLAEHVADPSKVAKLSKQRADLAAALEEAEHDWMAANEAYDAASA